MFSHGFWLPVVLLPVWIAVYSFLAPATDWFVFSALNLSRESHFAKALWFFLYGFPKVMLLLVLIIFIVGIIRTCFPPRRTRKALEGKRTFTGNVKASTLGIVTPFCSCSAIPLFLGFAGSGIPLGVTFSSLIAPPMINEVAVVLLYGLFGLKVTIIYAGTGLLIAIFAGWTIGLLKLEKWIVPWVFQVQVGNSETEDEKPGFDKRVERGFDAVGEVAGKVRMYVALGIIAGANAHGYVAVDFIASLMGKSAWYSIPLSILIGIPLYSNAAGIVPVVSVLIEKGAPLGAALAFMMSVIGLSLPEMVILRKVLKLPLIFVFTGIVGLGILIVGYLMNFIF